MASFFAKKLEKYSKPRCFCCAKSKFLYRNSLFYENMLQFYARCVTIHTQITHYIYEYILHNTRYVAFIHMVKRTIGLKVIKAMKKNSKQEKIIQISEETLERCILCGKQTHYLQKVPVLERQFYLTGAGLLCAARYHSLYDKAR